MDYISAHSFKFGQTDMWEAYGIRIEENGITEDTLLPQLRARKVKIPQRSGAFDFGAKFYDERSLTLNCFTLKERERYAMRGFCGRWLSHFRRKERSVYGMRRSGIISGGSIPRCLWSRGEAAGCGFR